jgi:hypothetical protein
MDARSEGEAGHTAERVTGRARKGSFDRKRRCMITRFEPEGHTQGMSLYLPLNYVSPEQFKIQNPYPLSEVSAESQG